MEQNNLKRRKRSPDYDRRSKRSHSDRYSSRFENRRHYRSHSRERERGKKGKDEKNTRNNSLSKDYSKIEKNTRNNSLSKDYSKIEKNTRNNSLSKDYSKIENDKEITAEEAIKQRPPKTPGNPITSRTGGAYIPPAKLKMMQARITDKSSAEYQRIAWEALKKSIHGLINKVNTSNIAEIIKQLLKENIVRGRGLLCKSIIQAQALSLTFTHVYAALAALINSRFPNIGELLLKRLVLQFKRGFKRNNKTMCLASTSFIAHLVNQRVAHEILALEILTLLVETPTDHSIEIAISFLKECGMRLTEVSSKGIEAIFQMLRNILHEGKLDRRVDYMIEVILQIRKDNFKDHEAIIESLDLVEEEDQFTHIITLEDATDEEDGLNAFKFDPQFIQNEEKYKELSKEMLGESEDSDSETGSSSESEEESAEEFVDEEDKQLILDRTETNIISLRRTIYLTIYSSLDYEECAHKLMKMTLKPGQEVELCNMILDCCCEMRTYEKFFGLLAQRFCRIDKIYVTPFENMFRDSYGTVYRLKPNQLRNVAKFFAHLLYTDSISWEVLSCIKLNEEETTSSGRIFIKIVFQELSEHMGLLKLNERVKDMTLDNAFRGLFPRDNPKNTRFAINFFTSVGLGGLTDELREHLKGQVKAEILEVQLAAKNRSNLSSDSSDNISVIDLRSSSDSSEPDEPSDSSDSSDSSEPSGPCNSSDSNDSRLSSDSSDSSDSNDHRRKMSRRKSRKKSSKKTKKSSSKKKRKTHKKESSKSKRQRRQ